MEIHNYAQMREEQLSDEIVGLDEKIAQVRKNGSAEQRCVTSYLKQLIKTKRQKLAALRYERG